MRAEALSSPVSAYSRLLTSDCLRSGVATPSFWPCRRACKQRQFSDFRSDSPLNLTWFWFGFGGVGEAFRICPFVVPQSSVCGVSPCTLPPWMVELLFHLFVLAFALSGLALEVSCQSSHSRVPASLTSLPFRYGRGRSCSDKCGNLQPGHRSINQSRLDLGRC
jgi:hypothetical protein